MDEPRSVSTYGRAVAGLFVLSALVGLVAVLWPGATPSRNIVWLLGAFVGALAIAGLLYFRPGLLGRFDFSYPALIITTISILASGGAVSPLWPLYFVIVTGSALFSPFRRVLPVVTSCAVLSLAPLLLGPPMAEFMAREFVLVAFMFLIAYLSSLLSTQAREQRRVRALLEEIFRASSFKSGDELADILRGVVAVLRRLTHADYVICYLASEDGQQLSPEAADISPGVSDTEASVLRSWPVPMSSGVTGWVARQGEVVVTDNIDTDPRAVKIPGTADSPASAILIPLKLGEQVVGVLRVSHHGIGFFSQEDREVSEVFARHATFAIQNARLYSETGRLYRKMRLLSITDGLTGLNNQRYLAEEAPSLLEEARKSGCGLSVLMIDSDCLKSVNDRFGHSTGDQFLRELATVVRREVRADDLVVRYAGDEFIAILRDADSATAGQVAERIRLAVQAIELDVDVPLAVSIGVSSYPEHADDLDALLKAADQALYLSKGAGRNRSTVFSLAAE